jgi:hypothetical protein
VHLIAEQFFHAITSPLGIALCSLCVSIEMTRDGKITEIPIIWISHGGEGRGGRMDGEVWNDRQAS